MEVVYVPKEQRDDFCGIRMFLRYNDPRPTERADRDNPMKIIPIIK